MTKPAIHEGHDPACGRCIEWEINLPWKSPDPSQDEGRCVATGERRKRGAEPCPWFGWMGTRTTDNNERGRGR